MLDERRAARRECRHSGSRARGAGSGEGSRGTRRVGDRRRSTRPRGRPRPNRAEGFCRPAARGGRRRPHRERAIPRAGSASQSLGSSRCAFFGRALGSTDLTARGRRRIRTGPGHVRRRRPDAAPGGRGLLPRRTAMGLADRRVSGPEISSRVAADASTPTTGSLPACVDFEDSSWPIPRTCRSLRSSISSRPAIRRETSRCSGSAAATIVSPHAMAKRSADGFALRTVVRRIDQLETGVRIVRCRRQHGQQQIQADYCVAALPASTLRDVTFDPGADPRAARCDCLAQVRPRDACAAAVRAARSGAGARRPRAFGTDLRRARSGMATSSSAVPPAFSVCSRAAARRARSVRSSRTKVSRAWSIA